MTHPYPYTPTPHARDLLPTVINRLPPEVVPFAEYFLTYAPQVTAWSAAGRNYTVRISLADRVLVDADVLDGPFEDYFRDESDVCYKIPPRPQARWSQDYRYVWGEGWKPCEGGSEVVLEYFLPAWIPEGGFWAVVTSSLNRQHTLGRYSGAEEAIDDAEDDVATRLQLITPLDEAPEDPASTLRLIA